MPRSQLRSSQRSSPNNKGGRFCRSGPLVGCYIVFQSAILVLFHLNLKNTDINPDSWIRDFMPPGSNVRVQQRLQQQNAPFVPYEPLEYERRAELEYAKSFRSLDRPLVFFHIPKTAGTAIEFAAGERKIPWGSCLFNHKPKRDICQYPPGEEWPQHIGWWHLPRQVFPLSNADPYQGAEVFAVVRDPYDRMLSEFYYICTLKVFDWRPDQCDRSRLLEKEYMNGWLSDKLKDREKDSALAYLEDNGHFTPQYEFVVGPNQVRVVDYVLRLDDSLSTDFSRLMRAFGLEDVRIKKLNALGAEARDAEKHLGVKDLDASTLRWIHELYPNDFSLGYEKRKNVTTSKG